MNILYGSGNKAKVKNIRDIIKTCGLNVELYTIEDIGFHDEIEENGVTFEENSAIKARAIYKFCEEIGVKDKIIVTDDAGLCVDKLNGEPGVYTGRYAGDHPTQEENIGKLLKNLEPYQDMKDRTCKFVCVLTAILPNGEMLVERGECKGTIALQHGKLGGLTYSPVFIPDGFDKPMGDMDEAEYALVHNHRDTAMKQLMYRLQKLGY